MDSVEPAVEVQFSNLIASLRKCEMESVTYRDPKVQGGIPVFRNTRVPVRTLFDFLEAGDSLDEFLNDFPSVTREQAIHVMEALFQATQGMPRKVNRLAHYALSSAALLKAKTVTIEHVQPAREELAP